MGKVLKDRLKLLVQESGKTDRAISMKATNKPDTVRDILRGKVENPRSDTIAKLAATLDADSAYLTGESNVRRSASSDSDTVVPARVIGSVQAGAFMEPDSDARFEADPKWIPTVRDPEFPQIEPIAFQIAGDSVDKQCEDGGYAICLPFAETGLKVKAGMWVVAARQRGGLVERTIKKVSGVFPKFTLHPDSKNPGHKPISFPSAEPGEEVTIIAVVRRFVSPIL